MTQSSISDCLFVVIHTLYPFAPFKLVGLFSSYQSPCLLSIYGYKKPQETMPPISKAIFITYGQIMPRPMYIAEKSK
jgi:hypothetical protein